MIELSLYFLLAVLSGVLVGLLPGFSIWTPLLIAIPFVNILPIWGITFIWLGSLIGSQYFGSVAALLYKIPGESSTLVYLKDITNLTRENRLFLIRATAVGSLIASLVALGTLSLVNEYVIDLIKHTSTSLVRSIAYVVLLLLLVSLEKNKVVALLLIVIGIMIAPKTDVTLPQVFYTIDQWGGFYLTPVVVILGLMVIPELFSKNIVVEEKIKSFYSDTKLIMSNYYAIARGTAIGLVGGLIPGQNASASGLLAYHTEHRIDKNPINKIITAEAADNSAVITGLIPLTSLGLPITLSSMLFVSLLTTKLVLLPTDINKPILNDFTLIDIILYGGVCFSVTYYFLSQRFLGMYSKLLDLSTKYQTIVVTFVVLFSVTADLTNSIVSIAYFVWLCILTIIGTTLNHYKISPLPLLFGYFLGNEIFWSFGYFVRLYS